MPMTRLLLAFFKVQCERHVNLFAALIEGFEGSISIQLTIITDLIIKWQLIRILCRLIYVDIHIDKLY